jgi:hypothetical protein
MPRLSETQIVMRSLRFIFNPRNAIQGKAASAKSMTAAYAIIGVSIFFTSINTCLLTAIDKGHDSETDVTHLLVGQLRIPDRLGRGALCKDSNGEQHAKNHHGSNAKPQEPSMPATGQTLGFALNN